MEARGALSIYAKMGRLGGPGRRRRRLVRLIMARFGRGGRSQVRCFGGGREGICDAGDCEAEAEVEERHECGKQEGEQGAKEGREAQGERVEDGQFVELAVRRRAPAQRRPSVPASCRAGGHAAGRLARDRASGRSAA